MVAPSMREVELHNATDRLVDLLSHGLNMAVGKLLKNVISHHLFILLRNDNILVFRINEDLLSMLITFESPMNISHDLELNRSCLTNINGSSFIHLLCELGNLPREMNRSLAWLGRSQVGS